MFDNNLLGDLTAKLFERDCDVSTLKAINSANFLLIITVMVNHLPLNTSSQEEPRFNPPSTSSYRITLDCHRPFMMRPFHVLNNTMPECLAHHNRSCRTTTTPQLQDSSVCNGVHDR